MAKRNKNINNIVKVLIGGAIAFYAFRFFRKGSAARTLNIKLRSVKLRPISRAAIVLEVVNPNNTSLNLNSITADVSINNFALSTINYQQPAIIPANGSKTFELRIKINPLEAATFLANLFSSKKLGAITITGTVSAEGITAPINITQNLAL
jgi:LEA14-like dessication related protein